VARKKKRAILTAVCECGLMLGDHGARPPHTVGEDCNGFRGVDDFSKEAAETLKKAYESGEKARARRGET
jgi:hypothetical protein